MFVSNRPYGDIQIIGIIKSSVALSLVLYPFPGFKVPRINGYKLKK